MIRLAPDRVGNYTNIVTHYNTIGEYQKYNLGMVGPALGRFANRIANAKFTLDGKEYNLTKNSREHILHGGNKGFDHVVWDVVSSDSKKLVLKCVLPDGADGFPGNLTTTLTYSLTDDNGLSIAYEATTDKPTVVNLSNHSYFNLMWRQTRLRRLLRMVFLRVSSLMLREQPTTSRADAA